MVNYNPNYQIGLLNIKSLNHKAINKSLNFNLLIKISFNCNNNLIRVNLNSLK